MASVCALLSRGRPAIVDGFYSVNFERLDDAVRARKALNGRDVLGSDVGAIRIGFAKVPVKNGQDGNGGQDEAANVGVQGVGDLSVGATIHALRNIKGAGTIPVDQQVLSGSLENYRSNLLLSMIASGAHAGYDGVSKPAGWTASVTEQQMVMKELSGGSPDAEADIQTLAGAWSYLFVLHVAVVDVLVQSSGLRLCIILLSPWSLRDPTTGVGTRLSFANCARGSIRAPSRLRRSTMSQLTSSMVRSSTSLRTGSATR